MVERNLYRLIIVLIGASFFGCEDVDTNNKKGADKITFTTKGIAKNDFFNEMEELSFIRIDSKNWFYENGGVRQRLTFIFEVLLKNNIKDTLLLSLNRSMSYSNYSKNIEADTLIGFNEEYTQDYFTLAINSTNLLNKNLIIDEEDFFYIELLTEKRIKGCLYFDSFVLNLDKVLNAER